MTYLNLCAETSLLSVKTTTPKKITTSSGKEIFIYDDLYDLTERSYFYSFALNSKYSPLGADTKFLEHRKDFNLTSNFTEDDLFGLKFWASKSSKQLEKHFLGMRIDNVRINLSTLSDNNRIHVDNTLHKAAYCRTLLYYFNMEWKIEWGGGLLITDDNMKEIEATISYVPGRVIILDGTIPHCISAPTNLAPSYRFSLAIQYESE